jgi:hypothetical protein
MIEKYPVTIPPDRWLLDIFSPKDLYAPIRLIIRQGNYGSFFSLIAGSKRNFWELMDNAREDKHILIRYNSIVGKNLILLFEEVDLNLKNHFFLILLGIILVLSLFNGAASAKEPSNDSKTNPLQKPSVGGALQLLQKDGQMTLCNAKG